MRCRCRESLFYVWPGKRNADKPANIKTIISGKAQSRILTYPSQFLFMRELFNMGT